MPKSHALTSAFVHDQLALRSRSMNAGREWPGGEYVLYWMQSTHRLEDNWALRFAVREADRLGLPVVIHQGLDPTYEHANDRIHAFILRNARELARRAERLGHRYQFVLRRRRADDRRVVDRMAARAALVVTDDFPTAGIAERTQRFAARCECRVVAVESHAIVPSALFVKEEYAARTLRPKVMAHLAHALESVADPVARAALDESVWRSFEVDRLDLNGDLGAAIAGCEIDHTVPPAPLVSGRTAALARLRAFCRDALPDYDERRSEPADPDGSSRLSPYLHFGQVSAAEVARAAIASVGRAKAERFLDELVTWRELALNFCLRNSNFRSLAALPDWVHRTMRDHARDPREAEYSLEQLERAQSHHPLWNAAQRELVATGVIHNVMRMYWGKSVLTWSATYADALRHLIHLNDKWALDGRDPSSYGGIQWCFGKFDRPWGERPVWGTIRSMSLERAYKKFDAKSYEGRWNGGELELFTPGE
ncbi:MAG: deoxyribodipyrimidine photo-lyase [Gemmatimonadetes bacterium]|nr:deoxyribodipyrimidine photo-lyase [Gemmatimonadota bacterium]